MAISSCAYKQTPKTITWELTDPNNIGGYTTTIVGAPTAVIGEISYIQFNGINDGIVVPDIPVKSMQTFTVEALIFPDGSGPTEPRFMHFEDSLQNRGTLELRLTLNREWYLDAFLKNGKTGKGFALIDSTKLHPADKWYWVAMVYDGEKMMSYVNGKKELEQVFNFPAVVDGKLSLGVRLNKVNWFKGRLSELRFHSKALPAGKLQLFTTD